jgi:hypothetical protein
LAHEPKKEGDDKPMNYSELIKAVNEILSQYSMKLTLRQIYYRLVSKNLIPNTKASYKGLSKQLVKAREKRDVDDSRIEDRSRKVQGNGDYGYDGIKGFIENAIRRMQDSWEYYDRRLWADQPRKIFVALEKDALSRLFLDATGDFRVQVYATRGYGSYTFVNDMAGDLYTAADKEEIVILYFGDYDPSGRDIERDLKDRLHKYCDSTNFRVIRVALTPEQISLFHLPPMPEDAETLAKLQRDPRTKQYGMQYAVELDAIEPDVLSGMIKDSIKALIDAEKWNANMQKANEEREELKQKFQTIKVLIDGEEFNGN